MSPDLTSKPNEQRTPRLLRSAQAALYLGVGTKRIRQLALSGGLPYLQMEPGKNSPFLFDLRDLDRFIEMRKISQKYP